MRKIAFLLFSIFLLIFCAFTLADETYTYGDFTYALLEDGGAELISYNGPEGDVIIPNTLDGHPVTAVQGNSFYSTEIGGLLNCRISVSKDHPYLATIDGVLFGKTDRKLIYCPPSMEGEYTIPQGVKCIGDYAFCGCAKLTDVMIPDSITRIGQFAFLSCSGLSKMIIPDTVTDIDAGIFANCKGMKDIVVSDGHEVFAALDGVLYTHNHDTLICFPAGKDDDTFEIPTGVTCIAVSAFDGCSNLKSITIPDSVRQISPYAFFGCTALEQIAIPEGIETIDFLTFCDCSGLTEIILPDSLRRIEPAAFMNCTSLTGITIPRNVAYISMQAFGGCANLSSVTILAKEESLFVEDGAFEGCSSLVVSVQHDSYAEQYCLRNGITYIYPEFSYRLLDDGTAEITNYDGTETMVVIPEKIDGYRVTGIVNGTFANAPQVTGMDIPDTVISIGFSRAVGNAGEAVEGAVEEVLEVIVDAVAPTPSPTPSPILTKTAFRGCSSALVVTCDLGSYAARYCEENGIPYVIREQDYADDDSWLN